MARDTRTFSDGPRGDTVNAYELSNGYVFVTLQDEPRVNAWGIYNVDGVLFDTVDGTVQTGKVATCNLPSTVGGIVAGVAHGFGATVTAVLP